VQDTTMAFDEKEKIDAEAEPWVVIPEEEPTLHESPISFSFRDSQWRLVAPEGDVNRAGQVIFIPQEGLDCALPDCDKWTLEVFAASGEMMATIPLVHASQSPEGDTARRFVWSDHGITTGDYSLSLLVQGCQVGAEPIHVSLASLPSPHSSSDTNDISEIRDGICTCVSEAMQPSAWPSWFSWNRSVVASCQDLWPHKHSRELIEAALIASRVHESNFADASAGIAVTQDEMLCFPVRKEQLSLLLERLNAVPSISSAEPTMIGMLSATLDGPSPSLPCEPKLVAQAVVGAIFLSTGGLPLIALAASIHATDLLLSEMNECEAKWLFLEDRFATWAKLRQEETHHDEVLELQRLLSRDGPWRGNYEDACLFTRTKSAKLSTQAAALIVAMCACWYCLELVYNTSITLDILVGTSTAWALALAVLWQAAGLTTRMQDQSGHLYSLHKVYVEILSRAMQKPQKDSKTLEIAQRGFKLEHDLIKNFMDVNKAGFAVFEFQITRSTAMTVTSIMLPSLFKHTCQRPEVMQRLTTVNGMLWVTASCVLIAASLMKHFAAASRPAPALKRITAYILCCRDSPLFKVVVVVVVAALLRCTL